ncbi:hypothetical protein JCM5350_001393 [Sporobolomyces pararoseus]
MGIHVSTVSEDAPRWIKELDYQLHIARCTSISAFSIAVYDWFVCLDEEVDLVWTASRSLFKYLVLFCRYISVLFPLSVVIVRLGDWTPVECSKMKLVAAILSTLTLLSVDYILGIRAAAIHSFDRTITTIIVLLLLFESVATLWTSSRWIQLVLPPGIHGCFFRPGAPNSLGVSFFWIPSSLTDSVVLVLTVCKVFPIWSSSRSSRLSWILLRDEIMYYGLVTSLTLATNILMYIDNEALGPILAPLSLTLSAVLVFHLILNLRSVDRYPHQASAEAPITVEELLARTHSLPNAVRDSATTAAVPSGATVEPEGPGQGELRSRIATRGMSSEGNVQAEEDIQLTRVSRQAVVGTAMDNVY